MMEKIFVCRRLTGAIRIVGPGELELGTHLKILTGWNELPERRVKIEYSTPCGFSEQEIGRPNPENTMETTNGWRPEVRGYHPVFLEELDAAGANHAD